MVSETTVSERFAMIFFDRSEEMDSLRRIRGLSEKQAQFTVVTGRRRIGKTSLVRKAYEEENLVYFFVGRKSEPDLCEDFCREIGEKLPGTLIGWVDRFADIFELLMKLSCQRQITLFIDEFQEFFRVNKSVYSDMQRLWDLYKDRSRMNLIVCGSIYSLMDKIFKDKKEPLFGRVTQFIGVYPFKTRVLKEILKYYSPGYTPEDLLALYSFTGGVPKYVELLMDSGMTSRAQMLDAIVRRDSVFIDEGKAILIEEFGKDYGVYFSILSAIARGKNTRAEIEDLVGREIGGYLTRLEKDYTLISKRQPLFTKSETKHVYYNLDDDFLIFWFRFIYKYNYILEIDGYEKVRQIIEHDYETFSGWMLERYFWKVLRESGRYTRIGSWRDRKGENEIDIIAEDEINASAVFYEVKRQARNISLKTLQRKAEIFLKTTGAFQDYQIAYQGVSMEDM